jgi:hypothetical protein
MEKKYFYAFINGLSKVKYPSRNTDNEDYSFQFLYESLFDESTSTEGTK